MKKFIGSSYLAAGSAVLLMGVLACSAANDTTATAQETVSQAASDVKSAGSDAVKKAGEKGKKALTPGADISAAPAGVYKSDSGHAYIAMSYDHQGFSRPILRWGAFDATANVDSENPENSSLSVVIDAASIDSGVAKFDDHLKGEQFFNVAAFPKITFSSTAMEQVLQGRGKVTGDLTIKDITKPVTLKVKLNKVGKHFRTKNDMFGISAKTTIRRDDFGVGLYDAVGQEVDIKIEVEFQKAE